MAAIASGMTQNLVHRAADVCLKERRPLVLVPRETPYNRTHLKNMLAAHEAGATILPASPAFYSRPGAMCELIKQIVGRILDHVGVEHALYRPWEGHTPGM